MMTSASLKSGWRDGIEIRSGFNRPMDMAAQWLHDANVRQLCSSRPAV
jgi:hypothetical protein